jgi:hypothetical protein
MKVDYITIYSPDGAKTFKSDPNDSSELKDWHEKEIETARDLFSIAVSLKKGGG